MDDGIVPIRLELTVQGQPVVEHILWDSTNTTLTPSDYATLLAADLHLPHQSQAMIAESITEQLSEFTSQSRQTSRVVNQERRIIKLNVRVGRTVLQDQFEWDATDERNSPEIFAEGLCCDLGVSREFIPVIATNIREQLVSIDGPSRRGDVGIWKSKSVSSTLVRSPEEVGGWGPVVSTLNAPQQDEMEKRERRDARNAKRSKAKAPT